jgi:serine/threonine-protein kinase
MDTDRNLLFGVLALQADLINGAQFAEVCSAWAASKRESLAEILVARGWITALDQAAIAQLLERKIDRYGGDSHAALGAADAAARSIIATSGDPRVSAIFRADLTPPSSLPPATGHVLIESLAKPAGARSRYILTRLHAEGGLGQVWVARDSDLNREVALKELKPDQAIHPEAWQRFLKEAQVTGQLEHPNIVPVYELSRRTDDDQPFYTMKFVRGQTLRDAIREFHHQNAGLHVPVPTPMDRGAVSHETGPDRPANANPISASSSGVAALDRLQLRKLLHAFLSVCNAVGYAHSRGVIHRDLKPSNVVLGGFGEVILLDWGLAKLVAADCEANTLGFSQEAHAEATAAGHVLGTPAYMAPEQAEGRLDLVNVRTDVYGLGTILFEIIAGVPPHSGKDSKETLQQIIHGETPRARRVNRAVPAALDAICAKAMAKSQSERYETPTALANDVQCWLADEPVRAYMEPLSVRFARWSRRHKPFVAGAAALLATAVLALSVITVLVVHAQERLRGEQAKTNAAYLAEGQQRARAEENFRQARAAVDEYLTKVSESKLLDVPVMQPLRKELLESALAYYQGFLEAYQDDPSIQAELAGTYERVASITEMIGSKSAALAALQKATEIRDVLLQNDREPDKLSDLANCYTRLGILQRVTGRPAEALRSYQRVVEILQELKRLHPAESSYDHRIAVIYNNLGNLYDQEGQLDEALRVTRQALEIFERLAQREPRSGEPLFFVAGTLNTLGSLESKSGLASQALQTMERAFEIRTSLASENPNSPEHQNKLAQSCSNLGAIRADLGQVDEALKSYQRSLEIREKLARDNPSVHEYQDGMARTYHNLSNLQLKIGQSALGLQSRRRAREIHEKLAAENPTVIQFLADLAADHNALGNIETDAGQFDEAASSYEQAIDIRQKLVAENPAVAEYQSDLASSYNNLALLQASMGRTDDAIRFNRMAMEQREKLVHAYPAVPRYQTELATSHNNLGVLNEQLGRPDDALTHYQRALEIRRQLAGDHPEVTELTNDLAASYNNLAVLQFRTANIDGALASYQCAIDALQRLIQDNPTVIDFRKTLGATYNNLGVLQLEKRQVTAAEQSYRQAIEIRQALVREVPNSEFQNDLAASYNNLGTLQLETGDPAQAIVHFGHAIEIRKRLIEMQPDAVEIRSRLAGTLQATAAALRKMERGDESLAYLEQAVQHQSMALSQATQVTQYRQRLSELYGELASAFRGLKRHVEAAGLALDRKKLWPTNPTELYNVACELALCASLIRHDSADAEEQATRKQYADQAMLAIHDAVSNGFADVEHMKKDTDLDSLRTRSDFQELLQAIAAKKQ